MILIFPWFKTHVLLVNQTVGTDASKHTEGTYFCFPTYLNGRWVSTELATRVFLGPAENHRKPMLSVDNRIFATTVVE
jgi:hypothetical protein